MIFSPLSPFPRISRLAPRRPRSAIDSTPHLRQSHAKVCDLSPSGRADYAQISTRMGLDSALQAMSSDVMSHSNRNVISSSATINHDLPQIVYRSLERQRTLFLGSSSIVTPTRHFVIVEHSGRIDLRGEQCVFLLPPILPPPRALN
jgi:hypothetical protein